VLVKLDDKPPAIWIRQHMHNIGTVKRCLNINTTSCCVRKINQDSPAHMYSSVQRRSLGSPAPLGVSSNLPLHLKPFSTSWARGIHLLNLRDAKPPHPPPP
jgi:hypothetical protein